MRLGKSGMSVERNRSLRETTRMVKVSRQDDPLPRLLLQGMTSENG
jgi:hypothetical protein